MVKLGGDSFNGEFGGDDPFGGFGNGGDNKEIPGKDIEKKEYSQAEHSEKMDGLGSTPFGDPGIKFSSFDCTTCNLKILSQEARWEKGRAICPHCSNFLI
ncbi:MAG: hypothetical protein ABII93_03775 [Chrysiogenia bacterium]